MYELVYVGAAWCGPCKVIKPKVQELCTRYGVQFTELDIDSIEDDMKEDITKVPTLFVRKETKDVISWNKNQIESFTKWLQENIQLSATDDF
jgi:thiol-disulfide isomerase/thioredoxin